jgi:hypothetical protein
MQIGGFTLARESNEDEKVNIPCPQMKPEVTAGTQQFHII